jgi:hypothetical protein
MMAQRRKSFGSKTLIALLLMSVVGFTLPAVTAHAEDCLAAPNSPAREGTRWYYRLDQATQHKCWYMRALDQSTQQAATSVKTTLPAPAFAIPIPRPRPSTANSALSLNPGDTNLSFSNAEEVATKPSGMAPSSGSTGETASSIPKELASQQAGISSAAPAPNAVPQTGKATDETDSAISEMHQAAPSLETNATATAAATSAETPAGATTDEASSSTSEIAAPQLAAASSAPNAQMAASGPNAALMDDAATPNDSATKLSAPKDFRSNDAAPAPDVSVAQLHAPLAATTVNARSIPSHLVSDDSERTASSDKSADIAGTQIRPFYLIIAFMVALVGMLYYLVFRYLPGGSARISIDDAENDWVDDDPYNDPEFYRKLRQGAAEVEIPATGAPISARAAALEKP